MPMNSPVASAPCSAFLRPATLWLLAGASLAAAGGCRPGFNDQPALGLGEVPLSAVTPDHPNLQVVATTASDHLSVTNGHDRSHWTPTFVVVPANEVEHFGEFSTHPVCAQSSVRQRRGYPTPGSVTRLTDGDNQRAQMREALLQPVFAALDVALAPVRLFVDYPNLAHTSPDESYERTPGGVLSAHLRLGPISADVPDEPAALRSDHTGRSGSDEVESVEVELTAP